MKRAITFAGLLALLTAPAHAAPKAALTPTSAWAVDYADERCSLVRDFGTGKSRVQLHIQSYGHWNSFRVLVTGPGVPRFDRGHGFASIRFPGDPDERETNAVYGKIGDDPAASLGTAFAPYFDFASLRRLPEDEREALVRERSEPSPAFDATVSMLSIQLERGAPIELKTGSMAAPLAALRTCVDDLLKSWRVDPEKQKTLARFAKSTRASTSQMAYPTRMAFKGLNAFVPVRVMIDAEGKVTSCVVQVTLVEEDFKRAVCDGFSGRFEPALDAAGNPTDSLYPTSVTFMVN